MLCASSSICPRASLALALACATVIALGFAPAVRAGKSGGVEKRCGEGVDLRLIFPRAGQEDARQGDLLLLEVSGATLLKQLSGQWHGREIPFWQSSEPGSAPNSERDANDAKTLSKYRALLGVDLEQAAGAYPVTITAKLEASRAANVSGTGHADDRPGEGAPIAFSCSVEVAVTAGHFATESLHVKPQFVEPDPQQIARANEERTRLREIFDRVTPERLWQGAFRPPLAGVTTGGNFGKRRILNGQPGSPHGGIDMPASTGTPVYAPQHARVALAEPLYFSGNTVVLDHGLGVYTFYGHLSEIDVKPGDLLEPGALLGKVGATGRATGPHLHWGLTINRARVNPLELFKLP